MRFIVLRLLLLIFGVIILSGCATSQSNYPSLYKSFAKQRYYLPSKKYKTACNLPQKNQVSRKFTLIKRKPKKGAEQP